MPWHPSPGFGVLCVGNEPVELQYNNRTYLFEWSNSCGWLPVNKDGNGRLSRVPDGAWNTLLATYQNPEGET